MTPGGGLACLASSYSASAHHLALEISTRLYKINVNINVWIVIVIKCDLCLISSYLESSWFINSQVS